MKYNLISTYDPTFHKKMSIDFLDLSLGTFNETVYKNKTIHDVNFALILFDILLIEIITRC